MKKKILSAFLTIFVLIGFLFPAQIFADDSGDSGDSSSESDSDSDSSSDSDSDSDSSSDSDSDSDSDSSSDSDSDSDSESDGDDSGEENDADEDDGKSADDEESEDADGKGDKVEEEAGESPVDYSQYDDEPWYDTAVAEHWSQDYCESMRSSHGSEYAAEWSASRAALDNAKSYNASAEVIAALQAEFNQIDSVCQNFAAAQGGTSFSISGSSMTVYDAAGQPVYSVGDPVILASGENYILDEDLSISTANTRFSIVRKYTHGFSGGAFGTNWNSNLDTRIIRCSSSFQINEEDMVKIDDYIAALEKVREEIEEYKNTDSEYESVVEETEELLAHARESRQNLLSELEQINAGAADCALRNKYAAYGYAGKISGNCGFGKIIFCDDDGNAILLSKSDSGTYLPVQKIYSGKIEITENETGYEVSFRGGEKRIYNEYGLPLAFFRRGGGRINFSYNDDFVLEKIVVDGKVPMLFSWDGRRLVSTFSGTRTTAYSYLDGFLSSATDFEGDKKSFEYGADGRIIRQIKADGSFVSFCYEEAGGLVRTSSVTNELGGTERFFYDTENRLVTHIDFDGVESLYQCDSEGRTICEKYPDGKEVRYEYDDFGNVVSRTDNFGQKTYFYDECGNVLQISFPDGSSERFSYSDGNLVSRISRGGHRTDFLYNQDKNLSVVFKGNQPVASFEYDSDGFLTSYCDSIGTRTFFSYDSYGNITQRKKGASVEQWRYDEDGRIIEYIDPLGNKEVHEYAPHKEKIVFSLGLEIEKTYSSRKLLVSKKITDTKTGESRLFEYEYDRNKNCTGYFVSGVDSLGNKYERTQTIGITYTSGGRATSYETRNIFRPNSEVEGWKSNFFWDQSGNLCSVEQGFLSGNYVVDGKFVDFTRTISQDGIELTESYYDGIEKKSFYNINGILFKEALNNCILSQKEISPDGRILKISSDSSGDIGFLYDSEGFLNSYVYEGGVQKSFASIKRTAGGIVVSATDENGIRKNFFYDECGNCVRMESSVCSIDCGYDAGGRVTFWKILDAFGKIVFEAEWSYGNDRRTVSVTYGKKYKFSLELNAFGEIIQKTDALNNTVRFFYDVMGRKILETDSYGKNTRFVWNGQYQIEKIIWGNGSFVEYEYDSFLNCVGCKDSEGKIWSASYDSLGRVKSFSRRPFFRTEWYEYDEFGRVTKVSAESSGGRKTLKSFVYGQKGSSVVRMDSKAKTTVSLLDGFGKILSVKNRLGDEQTFSYGADGRVTGDMDFARNETRYLYSSDALSATMLFSDGTSALSKTDCMGHILEIKNDDEELRFTYDSAGKMVSQYDVKNEVVVLYRYDERGFLTSIKSSGLGTDRNISYEYGKNGEILCVNDFIGSGENSRTVSVRFVYDELGREILRVWSGGESLRTVYDKIGRVVLKAGFDSQSNIVFVDGSVFGSLGEKVLSFDSSFQVTRYEYDSDGRLSAVMYPYSARMFEHLKKSAVLSGLSFLESDIKFDTTTVSTSEYEKLKSICALLSRSAQIQSSVSSLKESFSYDSEGNCISRSTPFGVIKSSFDDENRILSWGSAGTFSYDKNGNLVSEKNLYEEKYFSYNAMNRMKSACVYNAVDDKITEIACAYDALGRRTVYSSSEFGSVRTMYLGLGLKQLASMKISSATEVRSAKKEDSSEFRYLKGYSGEPGNRSLGGPDGGKSRGVFFGGFAGYDSYSNAPVYAGTSPVSVTQIGSSESGYSSFALMCNSVSSVSAACGENGLTNTYDFDVFGSPLSAESPAFGFVGKRYDAATGLYDFGFRDYSAALGRFSSLDPIRDGDNWYSYCMGNPVSYVDDTGLWVVETTEQYMNDDNWANDTLGNSETLTLGKAGCAVTAAAQAISALTYEEVSVTDINNNKEYFSGANIDFNSVFSEYDLKSETLFGMRPGDPSICEMVKNARDNETNLFGKAESTKESMIVGLINEQVQKEEDIVIIAQVAYHTAGVTSGGVVYYDYHFVTLTGEIFEKDGVSYAYIKGTSKNDYAVDAWTMRGKSGWIRENGRIAVPVNNIGRIDIVHRKSEKSVLDWMEEYRTSGRNYVKATDEKNKSAKND